MMPVYRGELKQIANPEGGGYITTRTDYSDGSSRYGWAKNRMVFPLIRIGEHELEGLFVASDQLGRDVSSNLTVGEDVCLITFRHLIRKQIIIGARDGDGTWFTMLKRGYFTALLFYGVFEPMILLIPCAVAGMLLGMIGGQRGTALGLLLGVFWAVGLSWYTGYRFVKAYGQMKALSRETGHYGEAVRTS
jgi:hypothetical protein